MNIITDIPKSPPYQDLSQISYHLLQHKAKSGLTFDEIGKAIGRDEVWVAAAFYGQAILSDEEHDKLHQVMGSSVPRGGNRWFPQRGLGPIPPTDPVIYRLYEGILVYGQAIKAVIHEKFGDGIMSMIDCTVKVDKKPDPKGDRVVLTFDGKFLPYAKW